MLSRRLLRIKVVKSLYAFRQSEGGDVSAAVRNLRFSIDKCYALYFQMLWLIVEVARYARSRQEIARRKQLPTPEDLSPNTKFVDNVLIARIETDDRICAYMDTHSLGWTQYPELVKYLYGELVNSDFYKAYMESASRGFREDVKVVRQFFCSSFLEDSTLLEDVLEEQSLMWNDDLGFALTMVVRTLDDCRASQTEIPVRPEFKSEEDLVFACDLLEYAIDDFDENLKCVERFTTNWDVERIAFMDNIIMCTAISELRHFDSIPIKVTLDEYIEIVKYYSTPGSNVFINGVLDRVAGYLTEQGQIRKQGRGLL